ncbi:MAG: mannonate dehydratase, partial [Prevotella sp.]|nr:mannonate dehydratase [Prevotella sp.]
GDFTEASHLGGRADLVEVAKIFEKIKPGLPMRVDHGPNMLGDENRGYNAGYTFLGRMFALGQVSGILHTIKHG